MRTRIGFRRIMAILMFLPAFDLAAREIAVLGPIEALTPDSKIVVLGQSFSINRDTSVYEGARRADNKTSLVSSQAILPRAVIVVGHQSHDGAFTAKRIRLLDTQYVPGGTDVYIQGVVTSLDPTRALLTIGTTKILLSDTNSLNQIEALVGDCISVVGTQPLPNGVILARGAVVTRCDGSLSKNGSGSVDRGTSAANIWSGAQGAGLGTSALRFGIQSITGTGRNETTSDKASITGTGKLSITGTGRFGMRMLTDLQSITGTGKASITGTGKASITGTGKASITGTGKASITGTGKASITGTGKASITGTGKASITGTGKASITGTGKASITGTGKASITGTGRLAPSATLQIQSITGTGKASITDGGRAPLAAVIQVQSITGTGKASSD